MNRITSLLLSFLAASFILTGCSDDNPADDGSDNNNDGDPTADIIDYTGTSGFVLNGEDYSNVVIDSKGTVIAAQTTPFLQTNVQITGKIEGTTGIQLTIRFSDTTAGTYDVQNASVGGQLDDLIDVVIGGDIDNSYVSTGGTITVTEYGAVGETVAGTFIATLKHAGSDRTIAVKGAFSALRFL